MISVGLVSICSPCIIFFVKIMSAPKTIRTLKKLNIIKLNIKLKLPKLSSFSFLTYLE